MFLREEVPIIDSATISILYISETLNWTVQLSHYNEISKCIYTEIKVFRNKCSNAIINH